MEYIFEIFCIRLALSLIEIAEYFTIVVMLYKKTILYSRIRKEISSFNTRARAIFFQIAETVKRLSVIKNDVPLFL